MLKASVQVRVLNKDTIKRVDVRMCAWAAVKKAEIDAKRPIFNAK